jgi:tetratricopeptide (TPR) repeat protein
MPRKLRQKKTEVPHFVIFLGLAVLTLLVFGQVTTHQFLNYDDGQFIYENPHVSRGLTAESIGWAISSTEIGWYPLTWLSHMLDVDLWQTRAGMHLMTSVALHFLSACLLFLALQTMTRATWQSAFVAALFAIHPAHVESVAWVSERKDTLSTVFAMLAIYFYATAPERKWRVFVAMALSLMAKQMYITLPFVLLLLDFWPLQRRGLRNLIVEKLPLFALTVFGAVMAVVGQRNLTAMQSIETVPLGLRLSNAAVSYVRYIGKFFAPVHLAALYPMQPIPPALAVGAVILLLAISIAAFYFRNDMPWLFTGWFWFVGTLVPVIGIVQIGIQSIADRYTYFSFIGLSIAIAWSIPRRALIPVAAIVTLAFTAIAFRQAGYWRDSETLFAHTLAVTPPNALAEYTLGQTLEMTKPEQAIAHLRRGIELVEQMRGADPHWHAQVYVGLGTAIMMRARPLPPGPQRTAEINDAIAQFQRALAIDPAAPHAKNNIALAQQWLSATAPPSPGSPGGPPPR